MPLHRRQDEEDEGAAQLAKLPLMSVLVLQVALSFDSFQPQSQA